MKKTSYEPHPQFIRERSSNMPSQPSDSMDLGYISGKKPRNSRRRRRRIQQILVLVIIMLLGTIGVIYAVQKRGNTPSASSSSLPFDSSVSLQSAVDSVDEASEESASGSASASKVFENRAAAFVGLQESLSAFAGDFKGRIGIYYLNLTTGESFGLHEKMPFVAASSIKLGINTLLYKKVAEGAFKFTDMLTYDNRPYPQGDMEPGTGTVITQPNGTQFTVRRTAQLSITISDNCATNMVIRKLGGIDAVVPYLTSISGEVPYRTSVAYVDYSGTTVSGRHRISAKDLALYASHFYQLWKASPKDYTPLMEDLQSTVFTFGIQSKLPATVKVAHKIGTNGDWKTENDAGIVFAKEPYVLCVTTENPSQATGRDAVAEVSLRVYNYIAEVTK